MLCIYIVVSLGLVVCVVYRLFTWHGVDFGLRFGVEWWMYVSCVCV